MIGFNELGRKGNLGNQMFQFAALMGIARHHDYDFMVPPVDSTRIHGYDLFKYFAMESVGPSNIGYVPFRTHFTAIRHWPNSGEHVFSKKFVDTFPDHRNLNGFFQSESYFYHVRDEVVANFRFHSEHELQLELETGLLTLGPFIAIHIRRGDYLKRPDIHRALDVDYYQAALDMLPKDLPVAIFSNDLEWAKSQPLFDRDPRVRFIQTSHYGLDLLGISLAKHVIIANSTFSWWGAYLSSASSVVCPKKWFGPKFEKRPLTGLYPESWQQIDF